jgi:hypothetical protein
MSKAKRIPLVPPGNNPVIPRLETAPAECEDDDQPEKIPAESPRPEPPAQNDPILVPASERLKANITGKGHVPIHLAILLGPDPDPADYLTNHLEVRLLTAAQRIGLRRLWSGLDAAGVRLANDKRPARAGDAIRWLLEQIAVAGQISEASGAAAEKSAPD